MATPSAAVEMNGLGTITAACLGSPFPTTLYLGHAAHKANGARSGSRSGLTTNEWSVARLDLRLYMLTDMLQG
jgi:hypothetical protein